jgi:hypothetical protein
LPVHDRLQRTLASGWVDVAWLAFAAANLVAMALVPRWETIPFHFIWVSLTIVYGFRVWGASKTALLLGAVVVSTGALLVYDVLREGELADELAEVPLMGAWSGMLSGAAARWRACGGCPTPTCACSSGSASSSRTRPMSCAPRSPWRSATPS